MIFYIVVNNLNRFALKLVSLNKTEAVVGLVTFLATTILKVLANFVIDFSCKFWRNPS